MIQINLVGNMKSIVNIVLSIFLTFLVCGCTNSATRDKGHDSKVESKIINLINESKLKKEVDIKISALDSNEASMICFQGPYMTQEVFERQVGRRVDGFQLISDDEYRWWLFDKNNNSLYLSVPRVSVADKDEKLSQACFRSENYILHLSCSTTCIYTFRRK